MPKSRSCAWLLAAATLTVVAGCGPVLAGSLPNSGAPIGGSAPNPTVVELFQSQGCSSCPPANALLNAMADRPGVLALSFAVTYWDQLGWKDIFGSPRFTARQQDYARAGRGEVATPELIVNGSYAVVGSNRSELDSALARGGAPAGGPPIMFDAGSVRLGKAPATAPATVWLVRYDPRSRDVPIRAGENSGRTLAHRDIVRELVKLGEWRGAPISFALPAAGESGLVGAVLVQRGLGGPIIAARRA
jgi:hypothetical protein